MQKNTIVETGSDFIPVVTKDKTYALREIMHKIFDIINEQSDSDNDSSNNKYNENKCPSKTLTNTTGTKGISSSPLVRSYTDINDPNYEPLTVTNLRSVSITR